MPSWHRKLNVCSESMGKTRKRGEGVGVKGAADSPPAGNATVEAPAGYGKRFSTRQLVLLFILLGSMNFAIIKYRAYASNKTIYEVTGAIEIKTLDSPRSKFARDCAMGRVPVVMRNSIVESWAARTKWTPDYLESKMGVISGVYENENRWFGPYFDIQKPLHDFATRTNLYRTDLKFSAKEFFKRIQNPTEGQFLYFTGDVDRLGEWAMGEIQPLKELLLLNPKHSSVNVWMGQPHVIAHCHYDGYHNFYAQLYGTKKFTLFKPTNWPGLYPYPFLHPSHAQVQVNLSNFEDIDGFPLVQKAEALEITLQPGDLLYMPPLWFHHVESMEVSISVNVWTDSQQTEVMERIFSLPLPIERAAWSSDHTKRVATSLLIYSVLENVCQRRDCTSASKDRFLNQTDLNMSNKGLYFVHRLWTTRYRTLMGKGELPSVFAAGSDLDGVLCEEGDGAQVVLVEEILDALEAAGWSSFVDEVRTRAIAKQLPEETWELWMGNYVEFVAAHSMPVEYVGLFLKYFGSCLTADVQTRIYETI